MTSPQKHDQRLKTLQAIHDEAVDAIITIDEAATILTCNPATESLFGYDASELVGQNVKILMPQPDRDQHDGYMRHYQDTGERRIIGVGREVLARRKDGTNFPVHLAVSEIVVGEQRQFAGVIRDLSEFKRLEQRETTLGRIIEESLNEIFIFDVETLKFLEVNRGARANLGYSHEELRQMTPLDIKPDFDLAQFRNTIQPLLDGQIKRLELETRHRRKNGTHYAVEIFVQRSVCYGHQVLVAIALDVTLRRQAELALQQQREAMQAELEKLVETRTRELKAAQDELLQAEKFSTLGKVAGGIAHEIRNPLNAVKTSAYFLLNANEPSEAKVREHLDRIDRQVTLIDNVVTALSDVARLPEAKLQPVNLEPVIRSAASSIGFPSSITIDFEFAANSAGGEKQAAGVPEVLVDVNQILIAIKNILRNARDAMPDGGTITIGADVQTQVVDFFVRDTGHGMSQATMEKILEPLYTTKARGMGLGLSITRAIVEKNQGKLLIESELDVGSCFKIQLRRAEPV